jgi:hypothetical protein
MDNKLFDVNQSIMMNNSYLKTNNEYNNVYNNVIWNMIECADESLIKSLNSKLFNIYNAKINIINNLLNSTDPLPIKNKKDIVKFFNILSPLNNEYHLASYKWNMKMHNGYLLIQNSICKSDLSNYLYDKYINPIHKILGLSKIKYRYYEFKSDRYYKNIDIIFCIGFNDQLPTFLN